MLTHPSARERPYTRNQQATPYFDALEEYVNTGVLTFHVPGHQQGKGSPERFRRFIAENGLKADITQVLGMDDIHRPISVCKEAQELAADAYGVDHSYFLVNGSSSGNHIMILAGLRPEDVVLVPRNAHRSTVGALILSGARPVFYLPEYDREMVVDHAPTVETVRKVLDENPKAKALCFTSPTYYGAAADVEALVKLGHERGVIVMADEAWGAHLHFHPDLPMSAVEAGADLVIQSTHKLLSSMSQASMLHLTGKRVDQGRLESVLKLFLSTSPSCLFLASLDVARHQMVTEGRELLERTIRIANKARRAINEIPGLHCYGEELLGRPGVHAWDPTKLVITARELGFTGYELERYIRYEHGLQLEMSDLFNTVAMVTIGHREEDVDRLVEALRGLAVYPREFDLNERIRMFEQKRGKPFELPDFPPQAMTLRQAFDAPYETVTLEASAGCTCAEIITPYPPGIPVLCPGEIITPETVDYLKMELAAGANIQGQFDPTMKTIRVVSGQGPILRRL